MEGPSVRVGCPQPGDFDDRFVYVLQKAGIEEILSATTRAPNARGKDQVEGTPG
jgi:hypothetical protein